MMYFAMQGLQERSLALLRTLCSELYTAHATELKLDNKKLDPSIYG
jgi:hypothetical protein